MDRRGAEKAALWVIVGGWVILFAAGPVAAGDTEVREFQIRIDGAPAGSCRLTLVRQDDGSLVVSASEQIRIDVFHTNMYRFAYQDRETWKDGRLERFESTGQEDGRSFTVTAARNAGRLHVQACGTQYDTTVDFGTTACWQLPPTCPIEAAVPLIDCTTGRQLGGQFRFLGIDRINVGGRTNGCRHFQLLCDEPRDAWYDASGRLVRQHQELNGHRLVLELVCVR